MNREDILYSIAFSMTRGTNAALARAMEEKGISTADFFRLSPSELTTILGLNPKNRIDLTGRDEALGKAEDELQFIERHSIKAIYITDDDFPYRLRELEDAPTVIYVLGDIDLNILRSIAFVGTRNATPYGMDFCTKAVTDLQALVPGTMIVSGLAYGIDSCAHSAALASGAITVAVLAHGLDMIYPASNRGLAQNIVKSGGALISEYPHGERPFKQRFLQRNRIIAGLCDATVVVESGIKGGAMSTANIAFSCNRDVMALPGRINDELSEGCNYLIKKQKAQLVSTPMDIIETMGWDTALQHVDAVQINMFPELDENQQLVFQTLVGKRNPVSVDEICVLSRLSVSQAMSALCDMEFEGMVIKYPGNRYLLA